MFTMSNSRWQGQLAGGAALVLLVVVIRQAPNELIPHSSVAPSTGPSILEASVGKSPQAREEVDPQARQAGADDVWQQKVFAQIERQEYEASTNHRGGLQAPNRAQNFRIMFAEQGIEIVPRAGKDEVPGWRFAWQTTGIGRSGRIEEVAPSSPSAAGARVVYERDGWSEWYENTPKGLEQGFQIKRRLRGEGPLQIAGTFPALLKPQLRADGDVDFLDAGGACAIRYGELHVWDSLGKEIPAELVLVANALAIQVDDRVAAYPLLIDPLLTSPSWIGEGNQPVARYGNSVATAGDVNGDGFSDVLVGSHFYDNGQTNEGRAFVYHGSPAGLSLTPNWTSESDAAESYLISVATAGDVNGDGFSDVICGYPNYFNGEGAEGIAFVYHGSPTGLSSVPAWTKVGDRFDAGFGRSVATAGDVNGDGYSDIVIGASTYNNGHPEEGRAYVYHGSAGGLSLSPAWMVESNQIQIQFGKSVSTAGDVNADGFSDVIVGSDSGGAYVYHGSPGGLGLAPAWTANPAEAFGASVATAGDLNGDGYSDVIVGAPNYNNGQFAEGRVFAYHGSPAGLSISAVWGQESNQSQCYYGLSVATAGDVNGDGFSDVLVGARFYSNGEFHEGLAHCYQGSSIGLANSPAWTVESNQEDANFGVSVATAGDVNGDGFSDVIVGAPDYDRDQPDEGHAFVYHGAPAELATNSAWIAESNQSLAKFGFSVATAGDVNGDGYSDVIVGASEFVNGQINEGKVFAYHGSAAGLATAPAWTAEGNQAGTRLGFSVGTAGDVNGDGYSDIIVGAPSLSNGQVGEGRAFVYHGSSAGLATIPAWTAESDQAQASFGGSVSSAGDVNGDGYSDVIVGALGFSNGQAGEGRACVYHGSLAGLATVPAWTAESDQAFARFGVSVSLAGDVNGDGFSDVIVGADFYDNDQDGEGRTFVYHGSAAGLATIPAWTAEGDQVLALFGTSVSSAGDVNGDGYSDVIVGARWYDNGETDEGRGFVYHGSASGLATTPAWTAESHQGLADFGISLATAGDVNGDGFSDVIVGARLFDNPTADEGRAFAYHGSANGLATSFAWTAESDQSAARFGASVSSAGDVNGDGFSDVIVGADTYDNGQIDEGSSFIYYGNRGAGIDRIARQVRTDDSAPIWSLGNSDSETAFRLNAIGRTPAGRGNVRLQFEVKPAGVPFDGTGFVTGPVTNTGTPGAEGSRVPLSELVSGLIPESLYHWRLRIISASPFFPRSPWLWLPYNAVAEADVRTGEETTGVADGAASPPRSFRLGLSTPNPFAARTQFTYTLVESGRHRLAVYDVQGRQVAMLADRVQPAGEYTGRWDGLDAQGHKLPSGVYFLRLEAGGQIENQKLVIAR